MLEGSGLQPAARSVRRGFFAVAILVGAGLPGDPGTPSGPRSLDAASTPYLARTTLAEGSRPNILIIITDDQRSDTLEVMPKTRRWFADAGATYTQAFATTPLCCPSRASIFTGRYAHNHQVLNNSSASRLDQRSTLQRFLHASGYRTAIVGKFLNGWDLRQDPPNFDRWATFEENIAGYYHVPFNVDGQIRTVPGYSTAFIGEQAIRFVRDFERHDRRPWLMYVTPFAPHKPYTAAPRYRNASVPPPTFSPAVHEGDLTDKPPFLRDREMAEPGARRVRTRQLRTLMSVDDLVGRLARQLEHLDESQRTMAFFLSDNGFFWAEHGLVDKRLPYSESVRIPFLLRWDGHITPGLEDGRLAGTIDIFPTVLAATGIAVSRRYRPDGRDLLLSARERILLEYFIDPVRPVPDWASIRTPTFQYIEYYGSGGGVTYREYYDLVSDPWQLSNVLHDADVGNDPPPGQIEELSGVLARDRRCHGTETRKACP